MASSDGGLPLAGAERMLVANRYRLRALLGRGGYGEVWAAEDLLQGEEVALKWLHDELSEPARVRREIATLRLLRLPGVVRLLDEGLDRDRAFLVMERIHGRPFPGARHDPPCTWDSIALVVTDVLETLGHIHAAGVVHRDLKPENILVNEEGRPVLLDFGLSFRGSLGSDIDAGLLAGTPFYLSPEQIRGEAVSPATDLYALGVLLYETLSGRLPHEARDLRGLIAARLARPPPPLRDAAPGVPAKVAETVDALLESEPEDRPASAMDVLRAIRGQSFRTCREAPLSRRVLDARPTDEAALMLLFAGPERLFHLRTDAAALLWTRSQGLPERVIAELTAWIQQGFAQRRGELFSIERDALDRLEAELRFVSSKKLSDTEAIEDARKARRTALELAIEGRLGQAVAVLVQGVHALDGRKTPMDDPIVRERVELLTVWVEIAALDRAPRVLDRALYELCRAEPRTTMITHLESLVRAALALAAGTDRAHRMAEAVPPFGNPRLERARHDVRIAAARRMAPDRVESVLAEAARWVEPLGTTEARAALAGWMGRFRYQEGRFEEAAELQARAAEGESWTIARIVALFHAAGSWMDALNLEKAARYAAQARELALRCRNALYEAKAEWILRTIAYRTGVATTADFELVDAVADLAVPDLEAQVCLTEAAVLFRIGDRPESIRLAERTHRLWTSMTKRWPAALARCLAMASGSGLLVDEARALATQAAECPVSGLGIQMLGLLSMVYPSLRHEALRQARELAEQVPRQLWHLRMDVLSVDEALAVIGEPGEE
jgi:hypothetical protein